MTECDGSLYWRRLPDGREAVVYPLTFGRARIVVGEEGSQIYEDSW